jgi:hypothetical protein
MLKSFLNAGSLTTVLLLILSLILRPMVSQPVYLRIKHPSGAYDQIFILSDSCGFVDVGRSLVYNGCWPSPVQLFSGLSPVGLMTIFYCLRFETSLFVASYDSQGYGGGIRPRLHTGLNYSCFSCPPITPLHGPSRKHRLQHYLYWCMRIHCWRNLFTEPLPRNRSGIFTYPVVIAQ